MRGIGGIIGMTFNLGRGEDSLIGDYSTKSRKGTLNYKHGDDCGYQQLNILFLVFGTLNSVKLPYIKGSILTMREDKKLRHVHAYTCINVVSLKNYHHAIPY